MFDAMLQLAISDPMEYYKRLSVVLFLTTGIAIAAMLLWRKDELEDEEQRLLKEFNILFQMKMKSEKQGKSSDFEKTKLLEIGERLDEIRASKAQC